MYLLIPEWMPTQYSLYDDVGDSIFVIIPAAFVTILTPYTTTPTFDGIWRQCVTATRRAAHLEKLTLFTSYLQLLMVIGS